VTLGVFNRPNFRRAHTMNWTVSNTMSVMGNGYDGYSFNITDERGRPVVSFG
jgi:hypothetical protein